METPKPKQRFNVKWYERTAEYKVSIPSFYGCEVVDAESYDELVRKLNGIKVAIKWVEFHCRPVRRVDMNEQEAISWDDLDEALGRKKMNRFKQRIPNFIYHDPKDLLDITFEDISEWESTDFYKWYLMQPDFSHFAIGREIWFADTSHPVRPTLAVWTDPSRSPSWCGMFDDPDSVDLPEWVKPIQDKEIEG